MRRLGAFLAIVLALAAAACGGGEEEAYSPQVESNFMEECVGGAERDDAGAKVEAETREYCSCTYGELEATVPFAEFAEFDQQASEDEDAPLPPKFVAIAEACRLKQGYSATTEKTFVDACAASAVEEGLSEAQAQDYCDCTYTEIKANVPFEEFAEYDAKAQKDPSATPPPKMTAAVERCAESVG
jgi:hypothetical protein